MSVGETPKLRRRRRLWPWLGLPVVLAIIAAIGWTGFWYFAARQTASSLDAWIAREKLFHRNWTCPQRQFGGFPSGIEISCSKPTFDGMIFGRHYAGSLAGFTASAEFSKPNDVTVHVGSPFTALSDDKSIDLKLAWNQLDVHLGGLPSDVTEIAMSGSGLNLQGHAQGLGALAARAQQGLAKISRDPARPDRAIHFDVALSGASVPAVDQFFGNAAPAEIAAAGDVTQASLDPSKTLVQTLDQWRVAGGHVDFTKLTVSRGETQIEAKGPLTLSPTHQLQGRLDTKCIGYETVLQRLGVDPALITAGSLIASLLGGSKEDEKSGTQPLHIPVGFNSGRLSVGPVRTSIQLPPLY
jgi:hypothetical protein